MRVVPQPDNSAGQGTKRTAGKSRYGQVERKKVGSAAGKANQIAAAINLRLPIPSNELRRSDNMSSFVVVAGVMN